MNITSRKQSDKNKIFNINLLNKFLFILIIIFSLSYIICTNDLSVKSFQIQEIKKQISYLDNENAGFEVKSMSLNSYNNLNQKVAELKMVAVGEIEYITGIGAVAVQK